MRIERIDTNHALYPGACALRQRVLLDPIDYTLDRFRAEYPGMEERFEHFVAVEADAEVVGVVCLFADPDAEPPTGKLMQMAVEARLRGSGIGRRLVDTLLDFAWGPAGLERVYCHARRDACGFYERLGWVYEGTPFMEAAIEHMRMAVDRPQI